MASAVRSRLVTALTVFNGQLIARNAAGQQVALFESSTRVIEALAGGGYRVRRQTVPLDGPEVHRPNAGLLEAALLLAANRGQTVAVRADSLGPLPLPRPRRLSQLIGWASSPHVINAVRDSRPLVIRHGQQVEPCRVVAECLEAFPGIRIAVYCPNYGRRRRVMRRMRECGVRFRLATANRDPDPAGPIVVCSAAGAAQHAVELHRRHLLIAPYATDLIRPQAELMLIQPDARFRIVGFMPGSKKLSRSENDRMACVYGFERVDLPAHGWQRRVVQVATVNFRAGAVEGGARIATLKRRVVWRHRQRTSYIARLGRALCEGDMEELFRWFPDLAGEIETLGDRRVVLVADNLDHASELGIMLGSWPMVISPGADLTAMRRRAAQTLERGRRRSADALGVICTAAGLNSLNLRAADILVDARSAPHRLPLAERQLMCRSAADERIVLIDVVDHHHAVLRQWADERQQAYCESEWVPAGTAAPGRFNRIQRIENFLRSSEIRGEEGEV